MKRTLALAITLLASWSVAPAQTPAPAKPITFGVSTIKPAKGTGGMSFLYTPSGLTIENVTLDNVIRDAYQLMEDQLIDPIGWTKSVRYDIEAKVDDEDRDTLKKLTLPERAAMVQALLVDRFHLKTHPETRELPIFNLVVAKGGPRMTPTPPPPAGEEAKRRNSGIRGGRGELTAINCPMEVVTRVLSNNTHHLVVDKTGLTGNYDFTLKFTDDNTPPSADNASPSIYTALQEQIGLKLEPAKAPVHVLVVDQIDQPTPD